MPAPDADFLRRLEAVSAATEAVLKSSLAEAPLAGEIARPARLVAAMRYATESGRARLCSPPRQDS
jgi:farnesyl diphosphate synthase